MQRGETSLHLHIGFFGPPLALWTGQAEGYACLNSSRIITGSFNYTNSSECRDNISLSTPKCKEEVNAQMECRIMATNGGYSAKQSVSQIFVFISFIFRYLFNFANRYSIIGLIKAKPFHLDLGQVRRTCQKSFYLLLQGLSPGGELILSSISCNGTLDRW